MHPCTQTRSDDGLTLIELLVYIMIAGLIGTLVLTLFINMWQVERVVNDRTEATTRGQLIASQIERSVRNANGFTISAGGEQLQVSTSLGGSAACHGFFLNAGKAQMTVSTSPASAANTWPIWQNGILGSPAYFTPVGVNGVHYEFYATDPGAQDLSDAQVSVLFSGDVYMRNPINKGVTPCW